ncbi:MAG: hypothetical protein ACR2P9_00540 [Gammaproteobacteria bacterium]
MAETATKQREPDRYPVISVDKVDPPKGANGNWYCYVIGQGNSRITGSRQGTLREVTAYANRYAKSLNERCGGRGGRYAWAKGGKKARKS